MGAFFLTLLQPVWLGCKNLLGPFQRHVFSSLIEALNCYCLRRRRSLLSAKLGTHLFSKNIDESFLQNCEEIIDKTILKTRYSIQFTRLLAYVHGSSRSSKS